jgi:hypothetical protein
MIVFAKRKCRSERVSVRVPLAHGPSHLRGASRRWIHFSLTSGVSSSASRWIGVLQVHGIMVKIHAVAQITIRQRLDGVLVTSEIRAALPHLTVVDVHQVPPISPASLTPSPQPLVPLSKVTSCTLGSRLEAELYFIFGHGVVCDPPATRSLERLIRQFGASRKSFVRSIRTLNLHNTST